MKKIKGSVSAIRMPLLIALFGGALTVGIGVRTYQLLTNVNTVTGFYYENSDFTIPVLYGVLAISTIALLVLSFLSKNVPAPKLPEGRNILLGIGAIIAAVGFLVDVVNTLFNMIPKDSYGMYQSVFESLITNYIKDNGGVFLLLELFFAIGSVFYFVIFGVSHFEGKATYKKVSILSLSPACWAMFGLISKLMKAISFITVSEILLEIGMLVFTMLFFFIFARIASGIFSVNSMWCTYGCGFPAAIFLGLVTIPRAIVLFLGGENVEGSPFNATHLLIFVFIIIYIISTLGVGFKNSLKKMGSVSSIVLPDDDEVVVKSSESNVQPIAAKQTETEVKKRGFTIAPEFKNIEDLGNFFDDSEADVEKITLPDNDDNTEASEEVDADESNVAASEVDVNSVTELLDEASVEESFFDNENIEKPEEYEQTIEPENVVEEATNSESFKDIPVEDISFYEMDNVVTDVIGNTVTKEVVESYEENDEEKIEEHNSESALLCSSVCSCQEDKQSLETWLDGETDKLHDQQCGEIPSAEISDEVIQEEKGQIEKEEEVKTVIQSEEEDYDFELMAAFSAESVKEESSDIEEINETEEFVSFEENVEENGFVEGKDGEAVEQTEVIEEIIEEFNVPMDEETIEEKEASVKSNGGFLEFSQMLLDDFEEDDAVAVVREDEKISGTVIEAATEFSESDVKEEAKPEKVKKEKTKKEKAKKEKVKKEKTQKTSKLFGKKQKNIEDDEPLTIVSLADLRQKKDEE